MKKAGLILLVVLVLCLDGLAFFNIVKNSGKIFYLEYAVLVISLLVLSYLSIANFSSVKSSSADEEEFLEQ